MSQTYDTQIAWQVLKRNLSNVETVVADKGFDWDKRRQMLRSEGIRPEIKHREFYSLDAAHTARIDDETDHQRSIAESMFFASRKRSGSTLKARTWFGQFRELVLEAAVRKSNDRSRPNSDELARLNRTQGAYAAWSRMTVRAL